MGVVNPTKQTDITSEDIEVTSAAVIDSKIENNIGSSSEKLDQLQDNLNNSATMGKGWY